MKNSHISYLRAVFKTLEFYIFDYFKKVQVLKNFYKTDAFKEIDNGIVLDGPFKGLIYPKNESFGSSFFPKILGTYEKEINSQILEILNTNYDLAIDVGCAEGYYAVGFAKYGKFKKVFAYDIEERPKILCENMAVANNVKDKVIIASEFNVEEYKNIIKNNPNSKILILLDIEGFEKNIFDEDFKLVLENTDFLIELHDFVDYEITETILKFFENKDIIKIFSLSDFQKALEYSHPTLKGLDFNTRYYLFEEGRPEQMKWYYIKN